MAIMARELMKYPLIRKYTGKYEDYLREDTDKKFWLVNTNKLVRFLSWRRWSKNRFYDRSEILFNSIG